eukprot:TRINITY_DN5428_c0_g1_i1.p1 TRINITY_DN5428_c0_g1~~TRINITY_DN5428_c0_g1_i1.p1  ORF type:complete len:365 (-),score=54.83 TRINITY_DN5428_c0_g1_i1:27-1019(-)
MAKATKKISETLKKVNTILEIRDARIPISSSNTELRSVLNTKRRVIIMNKTDLCNRNVTNAHIKKILASEPNVRAVISTEARKITPKNREELKRACTPHRDDDSYQATQVWLVCGMPNVGKSTFINSMIAKGKKAPTSATPGWTRGQTLYQLESEKALLLDTPGIMIPGILEPVQGLNLALCGSIDESIVPGGAQTIADYLVYYLNHRYYLQFRKKDSQQSSNLQQQNNINSTSTTTIENTSLSNIRPPAYYDFFSLTLKTLPEPPPTFQDLYHLILRSKLGTTDIESAGMQFLYEFRKGSFGKHTIDPLDNDDESLQVVSHYDDDESYI